MIDISCLGCKRSRVQISAARPKNSKTYRHPTCLKPSFGVQLESKMDAGPRALRKHCSNSWQLSHPRKTCHSRHFRPKRLILLTKPMSGSSKIPDIDPTFPAKNPTFRLPAGRKRHYASHNTQNCPPRPLLTTARSRRTLPPNSSVDD